MKNTFLIVALLASINLFSQSKGVVKGNITDLEANNDPLLLADVKLKGTEWKTRTNFNGNFEIGDVAPGNYVLEIVFLGYETLNMPVEVNENMVTEIQEGLSAKSISLDPLALSNIQTTTEADVLTNLERNMED